ncbi:MAG: hypothetical protein AAGF32_07345, partial [Pseudomonadota bacterium]
RMLSHRGGPARIKQWMLDARTRGVEVIVNEITDDRTLSQAIECGAALAHGTLFAEAKPLLPQSSEAAKQPGPPDVSAQAATGLTGSRPAA